MKKLTKKLLAAALCVITAVSLAACGGGSGSGSKEEKLQSYTFEDLTVQLPKGETEEQDGFQAFYTNGDKFMMSGIREDAELFASLGYDINDVTLEDYAGFVQQGNGLTDAFQKDEYGNLYVTYNRTIDGNDFFYYSTVKQGTNCFWVVSFACLSKNEATYLPKFMNYASQITVD